MNDPATRRNRWTFALGTLGRDMVYTMMALFLIVFLTEVLDLDDTTLWWVNGILLATRIFDAFTDIIMGGIIDKAVIAFQREAGDQVEAGNGLLFRFEAGDQRVKDREEDDQGHDPCGDGPADLGLC